MRSCLAGVLEEHLPGAIHLPLTAITTDSARMVDVARPVAVYCWDGLSRYGAGRTAAAPSHRRSIARGALSTTGPGIVTWRSFDTH